MLAIGISGSVASAGDTDALREAQAAFTKQQYEQALALLEPLAKKTTALPDVRRLKARTLAKVGRPLDALTEYEQFAQLYKKDDAPLLRDVAFGFITVLLKDMRDQMRGAGYTALKEIDSHETVPYFEDGLSDGSWEVRKLVAEGLGRLKAGQRSTRFRKALDDQAALVRVAVLKGLGKSGDRSTIPLIEQALKDEQAMVQAWAAWALVRFGRHEAWDRAMKVATAESLEDRSEALRVLGDLQDRRALPLLREALKDRQPSIRGQAAIALGDVGMPDAIPDLELALHDPVPPVRSFAALSLGKLKARESVAALRKLLVDQNYGVRAAAADALLHLGRPYEEVAATIRELTQQADPGIRSSAGRVLGKVSSKDAGEAMTMLRLLLDDPLPRPRIAAARSLGHVGVLQLKQKTIESLKQALRDQDEAVRATAAGALIRWLDGKVGTGNGNPLEG